VFEELEVAERRKFLLFMTGSDRWGIDGVTIAIQRTRDIHLLPVAHTCFAILGLPDYPTKAMLEAKLRIVIEHSEGFGLR
jgi:hypothetical protein